MLFRSIAIDYQVISTMAALKVADQRAGILAGLSDLPFQNLWLRASGFGAAATGAATRHLIEIARDMHGVGRPVVVDMAGGFAGLSTLAFGAAGGLCHGVAVNESFDAGEWHKLPKPNKGGGLGARIYIAEIDRYLSEEQAVAFFAVRGAKSRFACNDTGCCGDGINDMIENGHSHFIAQRNRQILEIEKLPEARRAETFLLHTLDPAVRLTRHAAKQAYNNEAVQKLVSKAKVRLVRFRDSLGGLYESDTTGVSSRSRSPTFRGSSSGQSSIIAALGGQL